MASLFPMIKPIITIQCSHDSKHYKTWLKKCMQKIQRRGNWISLLLRATSQVSWFLTPKPPAGESFPRSDQWQNVAGYHQQGQCLGVYLRTDIEVRNKRRNLSRSAKQNIINTHISIQVTNWWWSSSYQAFPGRTS